MKIAMVGLGRMGANMTRRLIRGGHECYAFDVSRDSVDALVNEGAKGAYSLEELVQLMPTPRAIWLMLPLKVLPGAIETLSKLLAEGDILIDGGNSPYKDDISRAKMLAQRGINYVDVGTSGGVWGLERGYCLMIGGPQKAVEHLDPIFKTLAPGVGTIEKTPHRGASLSKTAEEGYLYCGPTGSGHFVKMVHNGIEYGLMQAYAEGFALMKEAKKIEHGGAQFNFPVADIAEVWRRGSVVTSWLLDLTAQALAEDPELEEYSSRVDDTGEGRWTIEAAVQAAVPLPVITASLFARFQSRVEEFFAERILSAMRNKFGGHASKK